jgi:beta-xylosidase
MRQTTLTSNTDTPIKVDFALEGTPQHLELFGGPWNLSVPAAPTMFLRKQSARRTRWSTRLDFRPTSYRTEAGTVVWWNYLTYSSIGVRRAADGSRIVRFKPAEGAEKTIGLETRDADVLLVVDCQDLYYRLGFQEVENGSSDGVSEITWVGSVSTDIMTRDPTVGAAFTGMMMGLYAFGEMERCLVPAVFKFAAFE